MSEKFENKEESGELSNQSSSEKQFIKKPSFRFDFLTTVLGLFIGNLIISATDLNTLIENRILSFVVNVLILVATIMICKAVAMAIKSLIKKK